MPNSLVYSPHGPEADDPILVNLSNKYVGEIIYFVDFRLCYITYIVGVPK